jgi:tetratricopeptide (TPR) repeat protein
MLIEVAAVDPDSAYLLNLQAYSLFKSGRLDEAIAAKRRRVSADPNYAWGYFDLARFLCAAGPNKFPEAKTAISKALQLRPRLERIMRGDGEFIRRCKGLLP